MFNDTDMENENFSLEKQNPKTRKPFKTLNDLASSAIIMANFNEQYSQKKIDDSKLARTLMSKPKR